MKKLLFSYFGNGRENNKSFTLNLGETMTLNFRDSGTDTTSVKYYDLRQHSKQVRISNNKIATITHINNSEKDFPITLGTANANQFTRGIEWGSIIVRADSDSTVFEVLAF